MAQLLLLVGCAAAWRRGRQVADVDGGPLFRWRLADLGKLSFGRFPFLLVVVVVVVVGAVLLLPLLLLQLTLLFLRRPRLMQDVGQLQGHSRAL